MTAGNVMDGAYYYSLDRQTRQGPVALAELAAMAGRGVLRPEHLVWTEGMTDWAEARGVPGIFSAPPRAPVAPPIEPVPALPAGMWAAPAYAGFWLRFVASIIDGMILLVPTWVLNSMFAGATGLSMWGNPANAKPATLAAYFASSTLASMAVQWLYFALMESSVHQATLGKMALGLRVTGLRGERISFGRATGRHFAKILSGLAIYVGYIMAGFTERKQALHDLVAECLVVRTR